MNANFNPYAILKKYKPNTGALWTSSYPPSQNNEQRAQPATPRQEPQAINQVPPVQTPPQKSSFTEEIKTAFAKDNPGLALGLISIIINSIILLLSVVTISQVLTGTYDIISSQPSVSLRILMDMATPVSIVLSIISYFQSKRAGKSRLPAKAGLAILAARYVLAWFVYLTILSIIRT